MKPFLATFATLLLVFGTTRVSTHDLAGGGCLLARFPDDLLQQLKQESNFLYPPSPPSHAPVQGLHLALEGSEGLRVTWMNPARPSIGGKFYPQCMFGPEGSNLSHVVSAHFYTYTAGMFAHVLNTAVLDLRVIPCVNKTSSPCVKALAYQCGDKAFGFGDVLHANIQDKVVPLTPGPQFAVIGDMGVPHGLKTIDSIASRMSGGGLGEVEMLLHAGDITYANHYGTKTHNNSYVWVEYMNALQSVVGKVPYMTAPGNHENFYRTFHCDGGAITNSYGHHYASFNEQYTKTRLWSDVTAYTTTSRYFFDVPKNGLYWVMARPDPPGGGWTSFDIGGRQFQAYSRHGMPTSASAALYLTSQTKLDMELLGTSSMEGATMLSYVYLEGNTPEYLGRSVFHMAFTSSVNKHARMYNADEKVLFSRDANLNMGDLYDSKTGVFSISINGTYIISLRGHPKSGGTLNLSLHRNVHAVFDSISARGASSGQAAVFDWLAGDKLYVNVALGNRNVGPNTMISIALLWKTGAKRERA